MSIEPEALPPPTDPGWRRVRVAPSLVEVYRTIPVSGATRWRKMLAFAGPVEAEALLASGDPGNEICAAAEREKGDLIAMSTHGHKLFNDMLRGSVANTVRHNTTVPVLLVRGAGAAQQ